MAVFPFAPAADIIRATQKDLYYSSLLRSKLEDVLQRLSPRILSTYRLELAAFSALLYHLLTTAATDQSLGEEYCDILLVDRNVKFPAFWKRFAFCLLHVAVPWAWKRVSVRQLQLLAKTTGQERLLEAAGPFIEAFQRVFKYIPQLRSWHLALFYLVGAYHDMAKRVLGLRYILMKHKPQIEFDYSLLGLLVAIQSGTRLLQLFHGPFQRKAEAVRVATHVGHATTQSGGTVQGIVREWHEASGKCSLCLCDRECTTATSCGHLFCWACIAEWCQTKSECPLCRATVPVTRLVPIYNL